MDYKRLDEIVNNICINILVEKSREEGIYIKGYDESTMAKVYLNVAIAVATFNNEVVNMEMSLFQYVKFILKNWKGRRQFKWCKDWRNRTTVNLFDILKCVIDNQKASEEEFESIYNEYYGGKPGEDNRN